MKRRKYDHEILLLQGGGALGAYQCGVYEGNFATVATWGIPGFFKPRAFARDLAMGGSQEALSYYDTAPLKHTLEELVDFDLINRGDVRLSLGAVNVRTGESVYFDNRHTRITPEHVMASGALPPGFPAIRIDDEYYYDGGLVSNSPLTYVWDEKPLTTALIVQVNLFNAHGSLPRTLDEAMERVKDIQFSSKQRLNTQRIGELLEMTTALRRLLTKLPPDLAADPDAQKLVPLCDNRDWTIVHINNRRPSQGGQTKDAEFSRSAVYDRWTAGLEDVRFSTANLEWTQPIEYGEGVRVLYLPSMAPSMGSAGSRPAAPRIADVPEEAGDKPRNDTRPRRSA